MPTKKRPAPVAPGLEEARQALEQVRLLRAELDAIKRGTPAPRRTAALTDAEIKVGLHAAALIGPGKYAPVEVTGFYANPATGEKVYVLRRLDGARKGVGLTPASKLFPAGYANVKG